MKSNKLSFAVFIAMLVLFLSTDVSAQIRAHQFETIPDGFVMMGIGGQNQLVRLDALRVTIDPITGVTATTVQDALAELQGDINSSGDGWGADVVNSDATLSGDGAATPLAVVPGQINTADLNNGAGFISSVTTNSTLTGDGSTTALAVNVSQIPTSGLDNDAGFIASVSSNASITGNGTTGSPLAVVESEIDLSNTNNDAGFITAAQVSDDQALSDDDNNNTLTLEDGGTASRVTAYFVDEVAVTGGATSVTLPVAVTNFDDVTFTRNGIIYKASTTNGAEYFYVNGTSLQPSTGQPALANGEDVGYKIPK